MSKIVLMFELRIIFFRLFMAIEMFSIRISPDGD